MLPRTLRIIDANLNRAAEGLRFLEDCARFILNESGTTYRLKAMRHELVQGVSAPAVLSSRDSEHDVGAGETIFAGRPDFLGLVKANARRVEESLRVLEELSKLPEYTVLFSSEIFQRQRFELYTLERNLISSLMRTEKASRLNGLCMVLDIDIVLHDEIKVAKEIIAGGASAILLKGTLRSKKELIASACHIKNLCSDASKLFMISGHLDLALASSADGLYIEADDIPLMIARRHLSIDTVIGLLVTSPAGAQKAVADGADFVSIDNLETLSQIKQAISIPVMAIGNFNHINVAQALNIGADFIATAEPTVLQKANIQESVHYLVDVIQNARQASRKV